MRKLVSLGLCALLSGFFATSAIAGNVEECEFLKDKSHPDYAPGLYGLCNAWHNANDRARERLSEKFFQRAGFPVPGSEEPDRSDPVCPCTNVDGVPQTDTSTWGMNTICFSDGAGGDTGLFVTSPSNVTTQFTALVESGSYFCSVVQSGSPVFVFELEIGLDEYNVCLSELLVDLCE